MKDQLNAHDPLAMISATGCHSNLTSYSSSPSVRFKVPICMMCAQDVSMRRCVQHEQIWM